MRRADLGTVTILETYSLLYDLFAEAAQSNVIQACHQAWVEAAGLN